MRAPEPKEAEAKEESAREGDSKREASGFRVWNLARYSVPFHALLPALLWLVGRWSDAVALWGLVGFHLLFPFVLIFSYPWWRGQGEALALLILVNHLATFVAGTVLTVLAMG